MLIACLILAVTICVQVLSVFLLHLLYFRTPAGDRFIGIAITCSSCRRGLISCVNLTYFWMMMMMMMMIVIVVIVVVID